jgi:hypothetical protein
VERPCFQSYRMREGVSNVGSGFLVLRLASFSCGLGRGFCAVAGAYFGLGMCRFGFRSSVGRFAAGV